MIIITSCKYLMDWQELMMNVINMENSDSNWTEDRIIDFTFCRCADDRTGRRFDRNIAVDSVKEVMLSIGSWNSCTGIN